MGKRRMILLACALTLAAVGLAFWFDPRTLAERALDWIEGLGALAPVLFVVGYVLATVLLVPASPLTAGGGALFGVMKGTLIVSLAATLAATAAFLIGRYLAREKVETKIKGNRRFEAIDRAIAEDGWKIVLLTRLSPVFPFNLLNYAFGLTQVKLLPYVLASWIGMLPGTVLYVYLGSLARVAARARERTPAEWTLYGVGLAATLAVVVLVTKKARHALDRKTESPS